MPKAPSSPTKAKTEPYDKTSPKKQSASSSVKDEPDDNTAHGNGKTSPAKKGGKGGGKVTWTPEMDRKVMVHILKHSKIDLVFNWAELQKEEFPDLTVIQIRSRWDYKLKNTIFPPEVQSMTKQANAAKAGSSKGGEE